MKTVRLRIAPMPGEFYWLCSSRIQVSFQSKMLSLYKYEAYLLSICGFLFSTWLCIYDGVSMDGEQSQPYLFASNQAAADGSITFEMRPVKPGYYYIMVDWVKNGCVSSRPRIQSFRVWGLENAQCFKYCTWFLTLMMRVLLSMKVVLPVHGQKCRGLVWPTWKEFCLWKCLRHVLDTDWYALLRD